MSEPLIDVTGVRRERSRRKVVRRLKFVGVVASGVLAIAVIVWVFWSSALFAVQEVHVEGTSVVNPGSVLDAAGIVPGTPLARVDTAAAAQRVVRLREVAAADVILGWPHTVTIVVQERQARLAIPLGSDFALVDATGTIFATVPKRPKGVPVAEVASADPEMLAAVAKVADLLPDEVRSKTSRLEADSKDAITLELSGNRRVIWGSAEDSELKAKVLVPLLTTSARIYDVSAPTNPITRG